MSNLSAAHLRVFLVFIVFSPIIFATSRSAYVKNKNYNEFNALLDRGTQQLDAKQYNNAIQSLRKATLIDPDSSSAHFRLGIALEASGNYREAIIELQHPSTSKERVPSAYLTLGNAEFHLGHMQNARRAWQTVVDMDGEGTWGKEALEKLKRNP